MSSTFRVVIPARAASSRLPGKPLMDVAGRSLIRRVYDTARTCAASDIVIATEDQAIASHVEEFGARAILTSSRHESGTDRLAEVVEHEGWPDESVVVNLQGDEPLVPPALLDRAAQLLEQDPSAGIATFGTPLRSIEELQEPSVVKVVRDEQAAALYFSRAPIPWVRDAFSEGLGTSLPAGIPFLRHLGLYAYRVRTLKSFASWSPTVLERAERLEQLRALEHGVRILVGVVDEPPGHGVDTKQDLERVRALYRGDQRR